MDIRSTILDKESLFPHFIAACWIQKEEREVPLQERRCSINICTHNLGMGQIKQREIMSRQSAEFLLTLHIESLIKTWRKETEINTKATGEISHQPTSAPLGRKKPHHDVTLVTRSLLAATLFHSKTGRILQSVRRRPSGQLTTSYLPALNLPQTIFNIHSSGNTLQCELTRILTPVQMDVLLVCHTSFRIVEARRQSSSICIRSSSVDAKRRSSRSRRTT